jgi:hypothetical protein
MANGLTITIDTARLESKLRSYYTQLQDTLRDEWPAIWRQAIEAIALRAPSEETELATVLGGSNLPVSSQVDADRGGWHGTQRNSYPFSGTRYHFLRAPGMYIRDALKLPDAHTMNADNLTMGFGSLSVLEAATHFSWVDFSRRLGEIEHTSEYGLFSFFEFGKTSTIHPRGFGSSSYKLRPSDEFSTWLFSKTYPTMGMLTEFDARAFLTKAIASRIRAVKF